jgi:protein-disulfide isomerase
MDEQNFKLGAPGAIILGAVIVAAAIIYTNYERVDTGDQDAQLQQEVAEVTVDDDPVLGNPDAPVTIIEFSDYQCPFCRVFWKDTLPLIIGEYVADGRVKIVYRDFPLSSHPMAIPYAEAAECAGDQDRYWEMHDIIFGEQEKLADGLIESLTIEDLSNATEALEMDKEEFDTCMEEHKYLDEIRKDFEDGDAAGVTGTPSFFINGERVVGALPFEAFQTIIEEKLAE